jgi:hypothetical protein
MKKLTAIALCAVTALSFTAFPNNVPAKNNIKQRDGQVIKGDNLKIPNPFTDCKAITDAQILAGFTPLIPASIPADYSQDKIQAVKDEMVQIIYSNGENKITFRQGKGSEDISGDYNQYAESSTMAVGSLTVSTKGCNGKVNIAAWTNGKYTFAISANPGGEGLDNKVISDMISSIKAESDIDETVQIPNPFKDFQSIGDAEKMAGFTLTLPEKIPEGYVQESIQAIAGDMIQVFYKNGEKRILIRKAKGNEDISGDYSKYGENRTLTVGSLQISARGNHGKVNTVTWVNGDFAYSVSAGFDEEGFDTTTISDMVSGIR